MSKLVRTLAGYAACRADAIASGSKAQVVYFIDDAKADIATLAAENERLREATFRTAAAIIEARMPIYRDIGQRNALRECVNSIMIAAHSQEEQLND